MRSNRRLIRRAPASAPIAFILVASNRLTAQSSSFANSRSPTPTSQSIRASRFSPAMVTRRDPDWISLNGRNRGEYWLFKSAHFSVELQPISETFTGGITAKVSDSSIALAPELSLEELVRQSKPAVVYLKGLDKSGSGFFVTGTGVIVTNAHLARRFYPHAVPRMERTSNFETGRASSAESVDSFGNSSSNASLSAPLDAVGTVSISSDPDGAEIFVDEKFHGNAPAMLKLTTGSHVIVLKFAGHADWRRTLEVLKSSKTSLK